MTKHYLKPEIMVLLLQPACLMAGSNDGPSAATDDDMPIVTPGPGNSGDAWEE